MSQPSPAAAPGFPSTNWSMVACAGHARTSVRWRALDGLLRQYGPALRAYLVGRRRVPPDRADDLLQGFLTSRVVEQQIVRRADRTRGRFRTFLLTALDRYAVDEHRRDAAAKRGGGVAAPASLDAVAEPEHPAAPADADAFDLEWARQTVDLALRRMRRECEAGGRADVWGVFEARVVAAAFGDGEPLPYDRLVARFGLASPEQASNLLVTGKRMFARNLREVAGEYAGDEHDAEDEVRRLKQILAEGGGSSRAG